MSVQSQGGVPERLSLGLPGVGEVMGELRRDRALYLAMAAYIATAAGLALALGKETICSRWATRRCCCARPWPRASWP